jgi:hypothetical protein
LALIAPCGGPSGLPNEAALAVAAAVATPLAAVTASHWRRDKLFMAQRFHDHRISGNVLGPTWRPPSMWPM